jgi:hypothetical protein
VYVHLLRVPQLEIMLADESIEQSLVPSLKMPYHYASSVQSRRVYSNTEHQPQYPVSF